MDFSKESEYFIVEPRHYLGSDQFGELASIIRDGVENT